MHTRTRPLKRINSDVAYDYIRQRIISGEFAVGHPLDSKKLASQIGVSRTPVRDALRQLEANGLIEMQPHFGARVRLRNIGEYTQLAGMRLALESYLAGVAAESRTEADLHELESCLERMRDLTARYFESDDGSLLPDMIQADIKFHLGVINAARKNLIKKEILRLHLINRIVFGGPGKESKPFGAPTKAVRLERSQVVWAQHAAIVKAIREHDVVGAREAMARHQQEIVTEYLRRLALMSPLEKPKQETEEAEIYTNF